MNKILKIIPITLLTSVCNAINFIDFNVFEIYNSFDFRPQTYQQPFPIIFHYNDGGASSKVDKIKINAQTPAEKIIPQNVINFIQQNDLKNVQYFEAYCKSTQVNCNYFTHTWSMDKMIADRVTSVSTGMFEAHNLLPINNEVGVNSLVAQKMSYHDKGCLSGNVARFKIVNSDQLADAWFISVYNPQRNDGNSSINQQQKTIVVHWYFFKDGMSINAQQYPTLAEAVNEWYSAGTVIMKPQMVPVK